MNESATTTTGILQQLVERSRQLYSLPSVALQVIELTAAPHVDSRTLRACIENDPALAAKILRVVNSSLFGLSRQVSDLNQALALLGTKPLLTLVLGFSLPKELFRGVQADVLARYWRHTLVKSVACRELCQRVWRTPGDEAFVAGLLQDIGLLALTQDLGESYVAFLEQVDAHGGNLLSLELDWLGFDHTVLSARLLDHWGLPKPLAAAVAMPPNVERILALPELERTLPQVLHLAELFARLTEHPHGSALHSLLDAGGQYRQLTYEQIETIFAALQEKVAELAKVLALELPDQQSFPDLLIAAHEQLAGLAEASGGGALENSPEAALLRQTLDLRAFAAPESRRVVPDAASPVATAPAKETSALTDPGLQGRVAASLAICRRRRCPLSLALVEIEGHLELAFAHGVEDTALLFERLRAALASWLPVRCSVTVVGDARFALLLEGNDRSEAASLVRQLTLDVNEWLTSALGDGDGVFGVCAGLATAAMPAKNFPPAQLITAAERCLSAARMSSGNTLKSIEY